ncbi:aldehyde dehydrogenase family protein, partial [Actinomadura adrarensis]
PPGVINLVTGDGTAVSNVALHHPDLAGIHFTGSTGTFQHLWRTVGENIAAYKGYPRIVGETGGKDFVVAHPSADIGVLKTALVRGAFEYQGQKCSAASRAYIPRSIWNRMRDDFCDEAKALPMGNVAEDLSLFMGAVIDDRAFAKHKAALERARGIDTMKVLTGGTLDDSEGWFVQPTVLESADPDDEIFVKEYFGPIVGVHVYDDGDYDTMLDQMESVAQYALTGAIVAQDRAAIVDATERLRFA